MAITKINADAMDLTDAYAFTGTVTGAGATTPAFNVVAANSMSVATTTWTKIVFNSELLDSDSAFDAATNYRFTVPANEGGNYFFCCTIDVQESADHDDIRFSLYKNGSNHILMQHGRFHYYDTVMHMTMLALAATDYVEMYVYHAKGSNMSINVGNGSNRATRWCGFKLPGT